MRGKLVKAIRKAIYGDQSTKGKRRYAKDETGCIYNVGLRQSYNPHGGYILIRNPSHPRADNRGYVPEHVLVAERVLNMYLPRPVVIHHVDNDHTNNKPDNLVVCQDESYHRLLHTRKKAVEASGNPDFRSCVFCHQYDDPNNMFYSKVNRHYMHRKCRQEYERRTRSEKR